MKLPIQQYFTLLSRYLRPQWRRVSLLALLIFGSLGLQLVTPQIIRAFIDTAQSINLPTAVRATQDATTSLMYMSLLFLFVTMLKQILRASAAYMTEDVKWQATNWLRNDLSQHCLDLDMSFHNDHTPGALIERIDGDVEELSNFLSQFILRIAGNALLLVGVLALLYREDWRIGLTFTLFSAFMFVVLGTTVNIGVPFWKARREAKSQLYGYIEEWLNGTEDIRANGGTGYVMDQLKRTIYRLFIASRKAFIAGSMTWGLAGALFSASAALALGIGAYLLGLGAITIGTVYLILDYSVSLRRPIEELSREMKDLQSATASIARIQELFDIEPKVTEISNPVELSKGALAVNFSRVRFGYASDEPVLHDISFRLEPGKVLGLLGRTGSGKTTITRLLFRLHDPTSGSISLGEENLRSVALDDLRQRVGMVTQEVQLFQASVRDNLTFFDPTVEDEHILEALDLLGLNDWYHSLEKGLDTLLTSGGRGLSAGEAQLLAFTRVFLKDPGLVILDEASSRLDPVTEHLIERAIDRLLYKRTAIIVAHRLATVQRADQIMILHDGHIVEHNDRVVLAANPESRFSQLLRTGLEENIGY